MIRNSATKGANRISLHFRFCSFFKGFSCFFYQRFLIPDVCYSPLFVLRRPRMGLFFVAKVSSESQHVLSGFVLFRPDQSVLNRLRCVSNAVSSMYVGFQSPTPTLPIAISPSLISHFLLDGMQVFYFRPLFGKPFFSPLL